MFIVYLPPWQLRLRTKHKKAWNMADRPRKIRAYGQEERARKKDPSRYGGMIRGPRSGTVMLALLGGISSKLPRLNMTRR
jgi:hypothetical protein